MKKEDLSKAREIAAKLLQEVGREEPPLTEEGILSFAADLGIPAPTKVGEMEGWIVEAIVTPAMAADWLARFNSLNRPIDQHLVRKFAQDMTAGNWELTHQGLAFDSGERLQDGQHRLEACVLAKAPFKTLITLGLNDKGRLVVDIGKTRRAHDQATLAGITMSAKAESVARVLAAGIESPKNSRELSHQTVIGFYAAFKPSVDFALDGLASAPKGANNASVKAAFAKAHASKRIHTRDLEEAMEILCGLKIEYSQKYQPVIALKEWLLGSTPARKSASPEEILRKTLRSLAGLLNRETIGKLQAVSEDPFPVDISEVV